MTAIERWHDMLKALQVEQATGVAEGTLGLGEPDTVDNCAERRRILEAETLRYEKNLRGAA